MVFRGCRKNYIVIECELVSFEPKIAGCMYVCEKKMAETTLGLSIAQCYHVLVADHPVIGKCHWFNGDKLRWSLNALFVQYSTFHSRSHTFWIYTFRFGACCHIPANWSTNHKIKLIRWTFVLPKNFRVLPNTKNICTILHFYWMAQKCSFASSSQARNTRRLKKGQ